MSNAPYVRKILEPAFAAHQPLGSAPTIHAAIAVL